MDILLIIFVLLIAFSMEYTTPKKQHIDYLDIESTTGLRGIMAIAIILHHMAERNYGGYVFPLMTHIGYLIVAVFLFISGYGLLVSFRKKGKKYLESFFKNRILYLFLVYLIFAVIYSVCFIVIGRHSFIECFRSFFNGDPVAYFSWYIIVQLALYIVFLISFKLSYKNEKTAIAIVAVLTAVLCVIYKLVGYPTWWYLSNFGFVFGMIWAENKEKIDKFLDKHYFVSLLIAMGIFAGFSGLPLITSHLGFDSEYIMIICRNISSVAFAGLITVILRICKPTKFFFKKLGGLSLEIYLIHGLVMFILINVTNGVLRTVLTIIISIAVSIPINMLDKKIAVMLKGKNND